MKSGIQSLNRGLGELAQAFAGGGRAAKQNAQESELQRLAKERLLHTQARKTGIDADLGQIKLDANRGLENSIQGSGVFPQITPETSAAIAGMIQAGGGNATAVTGGIGSIADQFRKNDAVGAFQDGDRGLANMFLRVAGEQPLESFTQTSGGLVLDKGTGQQIQTSPAAQATIEKIGGDRKIVKDAGGFNRFVDSGERAFPEAVRPDPNLLSPEAFTQKQDLAKSGASSVSVFTGDLPKGAKTAFTRSFVQRQQALDSLSQIEDLYEPEFLSFKGGISNTVADVMNKLDPAKRDEFSQRRQAFLSAVGREFLTFRKWATGVAGGEKEMAEIKSITFSDEDAPQAFEAKVDFARSLYRRLNARLAAALKVGIDPETNQEAFQEFIQVTPLDSIPNLQERGDTLSGMGYSEEQTLEILRSEGYLQ